MIDSASALELVRQRPFEAAERGQDEQSRAGADADQLGARRYARVTAARPLAGAADDAGAVRAVADVRIGVGHVRHDEQRREAGQRRCIGEDLDVLRLLLAELEVFVRRVDARVVDDDGEVAASPIPACRR